MTNVQRALKQWEATAFESNHFCINTEENKTFRRDPGRSMLSRGKLWEMNDYFNVATSLPVPNCN